MSLRFQLTERDRDILKDVIVTYILNAEPVSSRTVAKHGRHNLSAASIRNVMADLEEVGLLSQPHLSAGRVPTREGYHLYIESMMETDRVLDEDRRQIDGYLETTSPDAERLMDGSLHLLKDLSKQVSIVLTPAMEETSLKAVDFVQLSGNKILCVVVSSSGFVDNKVIETTTEVPREDLVWISNYLTDNFGGMGLRGVRDRLLVLMAEERAQVDRLLKLAIELAQKGIGDAYERELLYDGASELLNQPELSDISRVRQLFETFSRKAQLVQLLNQCMAGEGVRVWIGDDSELTSDLDFSLVSTGYGIGDRHLGTVGIFGPSRMEYQRLIPLVSYLGDRLSNKLAHAFDSGA